MDYHREGYRKALGPYWESRNSATYFAADDECEFALAAYPSERGGWVVSDRAEYYRECLDCRLR